jgi:hypothetical protein
MNFKKWVKSIQTAGYNGARTVSKNSFGAIPFNKFPFIQLAVYRKTLMTTKAEGIFMCSVQFA